jgi:hypothetical protein
MPAMRPESGTELVSTRAPGSVAVVTFSYASSAAVTFAPPKRSSAKVARTSSSAMSKSFATAPIIVVLTIGTARVPRPCAIAMPVASIAATLRPGKTSPHCSAGTGVFRISQPSDLSPVSTFGPISVGSITMTWSGSRIWLWFVISTSSIRMNAWIGAPARSAA